MQKHIAADVKGLIRCLVVDQNRRFQIFMDNMKFQMMHKVGHQQNNTLAFIIVTDRVGPIPPPDIARDKVNDLKYSDILPTKDTNNSLKVAAVY
ncbi:MAG: hypothetical protein ACE3JU_00415 [Paenibacillus sp.]|uniref:hypothetical protein n=1 Tax=Paenibacillus sp. TaxID=58172 RepID=UPI003B78D202